MRTMEAGIHQQSTGGRPKRVALAALMAVIAMNIWTGGPLLALWIGSRVQSHAASSLTIRPATALTVFAAIVIISFALVRLLKIVSDAYDRASGIEPGPRRHDRWIASDGPAATTLTTLERILVVMVAVAALVFEIWFFFFSTSPIDQRTGRSAVPIAQVLPPGRLEPANTKNQISKMNPVTTTVVMKSRSHWVV